MPERRLRDMSDEELQNPDLWDWDSARELKRPARAIVSVAFQRNEFEDVAKMARRAGKKVSTFIRESVLRKPPTVVGSNNTTATIPEVCEVWITDA